MTVDEVMADLEALGDERTRKTLMRHGAVEPLFGVRIGDMKSLRKKLNRNQGIAFDLYATGNSDAMYLAILIADEKLMTKAELNRWMKQATWSMVANNVAALAAESPHGPALATKWIDDKKELSAAAGWNSFSHYLSIVDDEQLEPGIWEDLLARVVSEIHEERNEVKSAMNGFVISLGSFVPQFTKAAKKAAEKIGAVEVDHGKTACKTPDAVAYIEKIEKMGRIGRKKKSARC